MIVATSLAPRGLLRPACSLTSTASKPAVLAASMALAAGAAIGLAVVAAASPQATQMAVRAGLRAVALGGRADGFDMLIEGGGAR